MRLGHATVRYNAKMSIGNTSTKQQSSSNKISAAAPASRQPPAANNSDMCEKNRKIEFYLFTAVLAWPAFDGFVICDSFKFILHCL